MHAMQARHVWRSKEGKWGSIAWEIEMQEYTDWKTNTNTHQEEMWEWEGRHCMESWESHFVLFVRNMYGWGGRDCQIKTKKWKTTTNTNEQRQIQPLRYKHKYKWKWGACTFCPRPSSSIQVFREQLHSSTRILIRTDLEAFHPLPHQNEGKDFNVKYFRHDFFQKEELFPCCNEFF